MDQDDLAALPPENVVFPSHASYSSRRSSKSLASPLNPVPQWYSNQQGMERDASVSPIMSTTAFDSPGHFPNEDSYKGSRRASSSAAFPAQSHPASAAGSSAPNILAPTPRRHLIETSESQHWLNLSEQHVSQFSPPSPVSPTGSILSIPETSRGWSESPVTPVYPAVGSLGRASSGIGPSNIANGRPRAARKSIHSSAHSGSFSALYSQDQPQKTLRRRQVSNASLASNGTSSALHKTALLRSRPHGHTIHSSSSSSSSQQAFGFRYLRFMYKWGLKWLVIPLSIAFVTLLKLCIGTGSYSGEKTPPMYGDYEAQRHWMELTVHLPFREWYTYDLQYWGLDYPPLTAYVSWICGIIGHYANPAWVALDSSRGIETPGSKLFMRLTVLVLDLLVYVPALVMFVRTWQGTRSNRTQEQALLTLLFQPTLLLVDHGHFQYNSVMLGFTLLAINFFSQGHDIYGAISFVLSLGFKQMALYYAPAVGSYLLAKCIWLGWDKGLKLFTRLGVTTALSFAILFSPFFIPPFAPSLIHILHPITRIFPFNRGLFEDKVANFWCASNVAVKWKRLAIVAASGDEDKARGWLVKLSTILTAIGFLPSVIGLLRAAWVTKPASLPPTSSSPDSSEGTRRKRDPEPAPHFISLLPYALLTSSMSFFLFSFQVHEKTILLPLLPLTLLMSAAPTGSTLQLWGALGNNVAVFSMWPLLKRDGQGLACLATLALWNRILGYNPVSWVWVKESNVKENVKGGRVRKLWEFSVVQIVSLLSYAASISLLLLEASIPVPKRYPDLFPVLNVLVCTPVFILIWLWSIKGGVEVGWAIGGWGRKSTSDSGATGTPKSGLIPLKEQPSTGSEMDERRTLGMKTRRSEEVVGVRDVEVSS